MKERSITTIRGKIYYWISDTWIEEKETIFFFPGLTADHTMFEEQFIYFEGKYNIIAWDPPCHGKSRPYTEFDFEDTTNAILKILEENNVENFIAVGQSLGGYYIQALIARYAEKVKSFIGIGTSPYGKKYYSKSDCFWLRKVEWMSMCYPLKPLKKAAAKSASYTKVGYKNMMDMLSYYEKREYCNLMQIAYRAFLKDNRDLDIKCPVLITYGEYDKAGKVRKYCEMWKKETGYPLVVIKNAGHNANVDNPKEMNEVIENFLCKVI